jgi:hypothetical protein
MNMRSFRGLAVGVVGLSFAFAGGGTAWLTTGAQAAAAPTKLDQPHGVDFTIHSSVDPNYCVEDIPAPADPASEASMSECAARDGQDWTFANAADGSVVIIGGNSGNCLDFTAKVHSPVSMNPCTFSAAERFLYNRKGQIESASAKKCLQPAQANQDATISIQTCQKGVALQIWVLGH